MKKSSTQPKPSAPALSPRKKLVFKLVALVVVPIFLMACIEGALRIVGYGYPTNFFLAQEINGRDAFVENARYGWRFFPRALARRPPQVVMAAEKPADTRRIFVFGESAAMGDPDPAYSFARVLEALLRDRFPETKFEVVNLAFTAINSHVIRPLAREAAGRPSDVWIVYMGNNEVIGPFGPATVLGGNADSLAVIRAGIAAKSWKIGQMIESVQMRVGRKADLPETWGGLKMFEQNRIAVTDPRLPTVYSNFQANLHDIVDAGREAGAKVFVASVASNLKDCAPFASLAAPGLTPQQKEAWDAAYRGGIAAEQSKDWAKAIEQFTEAAQVDPSFAEVHFRLGRLFMAANRVEEARAAYMRARDYDALRFRMDGPLNTLIRSIADRAGAAFVDIEGALAQASPGGIIGSEFFFDHVHLTFEGNYAIGRALAETVAAELAAKDSNRAWLPLEECGKRLALTAWNERQMWAGMRQRLEEAPFTSQLNHGERRHQFQQRIASIKGAADLESGIALTRERLRVAPDDYFLQENLGRLLHAKGDLAGATEAFRKLVKLLPHSPTAYLNIGRMLNAQGRPLDARPYLISALELDPASVDGIVEIGEGYLIEGALDEAVANFSRALDLRPNAVEALLGLGQAIEKKGDPNRAIEIFGQAVKVEPRSAPARLRLGNALTGQRRLFDASAQFAEAVRLNPESMRRFIESVQANPENPLAHFHLATAHGASGNPAQAEASLERAVQLQPGFWEARYLLGVERASREDVKGAQEQFAEVTRLQPDFALAHLNLGIALAQQAQYEPALVSFERTLQIKPDHAQARQHAATVRALLAKAK